MTEFVDDTAKSESNISIPAEDGDQNAAEKLDSSAENPETDSAELLAALVAERTEDLKRLQAEYVNYKKRVDRDRALARDKGVEAVVRELMPVMDAVSAAEAHEEMSEGLKLIVTELARIAAKFGLVSFGEVGDAFDPHRHEALMQIPDADIEEMTVAQVMQCGYALNEAIIRPARVAVAVPFDDHDDHDD